MNKDATGMVILSLMSGTCLATSAKISWCLRCFGASCLFWCIMLSKVVFVLLAKPPTHLCIIVRLSGGLLIKYSKVIAISAIIAGYTLPSG